MKNYLLKIASFFVVCVCAVSLTACGDDTKGEKDEPVTGNLSTETAGLKFTSGAYAKFFEVDTEGTVGALQVEVSYQGGQTGWITTQVDENDVLITVAKNTGEARTAEVVVSAKGASVPVKVAVSQKAVFASELIGKYVPYAPDPENPIAQFFITPTYDETDPEKLPQIDMGFMFGVPGYTWPITTVAELADQMVGMLYGGGLSYFDFKDDGTIGAGYRDLLGFDMSAGPTFGEVVDFPNAETLEVLPIDAITYYTEGGKVYFAIDKEFLASVSYPGMDLITIIDELLAQNPGWGIVSTREYYALGLKYTVAAGVLTLKVDKEMMMPFIPMIESLVETMLPDGDIEVSLDPSDPNTEPMKIPAKQLVLSLIDGLFNKSQTIEIGIGLTKM